MTQLDMFSAMGQYSPAMAELKAMAALCHIFSADLDPESAELLANNGVSLPVTLADLSAEESVIYDRLLETRVTQSRLF